MNLADLFSDIARSYDFLNHLLSFNQDRRWRRLLASQALLASHAPHSSQDPVAPPTELSGAARILDLCTGTADLALELAKRLPSAFITGLDISSGMLEIGKAKIHRKKRYRRIRLQQGDVLRLPFENGTFDMATMAFGLRNLQEREKGLQEVFRVLCEGGRILLLEFAPPGNSMPGKLFRWYLGTVIPLVGGTVSGSFGAYQYLFASIVAFLKPERIEEMLLSAGFTSIHYRPLSGGIAYLHQGEKRQA